MSFIRKAQIALRARIGKYPLLYALIGGIGIVLFWRGIWYCADYLYAFMVPTAAASAGISLGWPNVIDGLVSIIIGSLLLLSTGLFVTELAGGEATFREEKKEEQTVKKESTELPGIETEIRHIEDELKEIHKDLHHDGATENPAQK